MSGTDRTRRIDHAAVAINERFGIRGNEPYSVGAGVAATHARRRHMGNGRPMVGEFDPPGIGLRIMSVHVDYQRENDRIIVAMKDGEEVARIVQVPGGTMSFRMEDGTKRGGQVKNVEQAKKQIERYLR